MGTCRAAAPSHTAAVTKRCDRSAAPLRRQPLLTRNEIDYPLTGNITLSVTVWDRFDDNMPSE